jgi:serralysin
MALNVAEQYLLELINRARLDPLAEAERYGIDLNEGLAPGTIDATAKQVLAPNALLHQAAADHSKWMLATDTFSHTGAGGSTAGERMTGAGYAFTGDWTWGENLAWYGTTGTINLNTAIEEHHEGLFLSKGHRENLLFEEFREIGIAQEAGQFATTEGTWNASMLTEKFAKSGNDVFVTGVVFDDANGNLFYDIDEGRGGAVFTSGGVAATTPGSGGYALKMAPSDDALVEIGHGGFSGALRLNVGGGNGKLDYVVDGPVLVSVSATIVSGIGDLRLLGVDDLSLTGNGAANRLEGNAGDNVLLGGAGDGTLVGGAGADTMDGGEGSDLYIADVFDFIRDTGTEGFDVLRLEGDAGRDLDLALMGIEGLEGIEAGGGDDILDGANLQNGMVLAGGGGHDHITGGDGNDLLVGGGVAGGPIDMATLFEGWSVIAGDFGMGDGFDLS